MKLRHAAAMVALVATACQVKVVEKHHGKVKEEKVQVQAGPMKLDISADKVPAFFRKKSEEKSILVVELSGAVRPTNQESFGMGRSASLEYWLRLLRKGRGRPGVLIRIGTFQLPLEYAWELSREVASLRKDTRVWVQAESLDGATYAIALGAEKIFLEPLGEWNVRGVGVAGVFFKGLLDKLGMSFDAVQIGEYKGAAEALTRTSYSSEFRSTLERLVDTMYGEYVKWVADARSLDATAVESAIDTGLLTPEEALRARLVDGVATFQDALDSMKKEVGVDKVERVPKDPTKRKQPGLLEILSSMRPKEPPSSPHVALVYASGPIVPGTVQDSGDPFGREAIYAASLVRTLDRLTRSKAVRAVVLRVDSPGGSALASKEIWHALRRLRDAGKAVVVSMGRVAASGGYFISAPATKILVSPYTITGSIGVIGGKLVVAGTMSWAGITTDVVKKGRSWDMLFSHRPFTDEERARLRAFMERIYADFVKSVETYRKPYIKDMDAVARGRIWAGPDAVRVGLADAIGGLADAVAEARRLAGLPKDAKVVEYPRPKGFLEALSEALSRMGPRDLEDLPSLVLPVELRVFMEGDGVWAMGPVFRWE